MIEKCRNSGRREKVKKKGAFSATAGRVEWVDGLVGSRHICWRRHMSKQCLTGRQALAREFQRRIGD